MRRLAILVFVLVLTLPGAVALFRPSFSAAQDATPAAACPAATTEESKAVAQQFLEAVTAGDDVAAAALTADGITVHTRSKVAKEGNAEDFLFGQRASFPDATMTIDLLVAEGDNVAAYVSWSGTLQGETAKIAGQDVSIPEGQRDSEWVGAIFFQVACGKITDVWPLMDRLGHLMNLGVITEADLQGAEAVATPAP